MQIGANISSLKAYNNMGRAYIKINKANDRLSSGKKINTSSDDAAGLAIANKLRLQVNGINQAGQNSSNGVSLVQTAEGALNEIHAMLQRIRELSVAASNDTSVGEDRQKMQEEIMQLTEEIEAIPLKTEYNKIKLLNGDADRIISCDTGGIQTTPQAIGVDLLKITDNVPYGNMAFSVDSYATPWAFTATTPTLTLPDPALEGRSIFLNGEMVSLAGTDTATDIFNKISQSLEDNDITITTGTGGKILDSLVSNKLGNEHTLAITAGYLADGSPDTTILEDLGLKAGTAGASLSPGQHAKITIDTTAPSVFTANASYVSQGNRITVKDINSREVAFDLDSSVSLTPPDNIKNLSTEPGSLVIQVGANKDMGMLMTIPKVTAKTIGIDKADVTTTKNATNSIVYSDESIKYVSEIRSKLGAYQNRLEHSIASLDSSSVDLQASLSRIEDTDMAQEMIEYTKNDVLYQAGNAILAQSNSRPQSVLQLLT